MTTIHSIMRSVNKSLVGLAGLFLVLSPTGGVSLRAADLTGLVGFWTFEEGSGTTTADLSGNNFNGTFDNVATWGGPYWTNSPLGDHALSFDGLNDRITIGNPTALQLTGPMTLSAWVYVRQFNPNNGRIITKGGASGSRGWALNVEGSGTPANCGSFQVAANTTTTFGIRTTTSIPSNQWIHLAGVYVPGASMRIYTNGYLNNEITAAVPASQNNPNLNVTIGARPTAAPDTPWNGLIDEVRVFNRALTDEEIRTLPEVVQTPLTWLIQPASRTVAQLRPVTFTARASGSPPHYFKWLTNGVAIAGATEPTYTIPSATLDMNGLAFSVTVSNLAYSLASTNAILSVVEDTTAPTIVSVGSADGITFGVRFSEAVEPMSATSLFNYVLNDGFVTIGNALLRTDGRTVQLSLQPPDQIVGSFTLVVAGVTDLAGNEIAFMSTANGTVAGFTTTDVGMPAQAGLTFSCTNGEFEITAGGADIGGTADQGHVALKSLGGDFDLKVRVVGVTPVNSAAEAGLMVRESLDAGSPTLHLLANPPPPSGRGWIEAGRRATADGGTVSWGTTFTAAVMPDVWLRLRRAGDVFQGFYATNGTDWMLLAQTAQVFPDLVFVGMAASAHNNSAPATLAQFTELGDVVFSGVTLNITQPPVATSAEQNSIATFTATAEGVGAPANELIYQWQRGDGLGGFTNVLGANESTLSFLARPEDADAQFRVRVYFAGLVETSAAATLTVTPDSTPPTIEAVRARGNPNALTIEFSEAISISTATDPFNYMIVNLNTGEGVSFSLPTLGVDGRTVTLTTDPLEDGLDYLLSVSGIQDLGAPPNTVAEGTQVQFTYSSLVGHWQFEEGAGLTTADATGSGFTGTLLNGPVWVAGRIGQGALKFDGADDRVDVGNPPAFHITGPITLAAWVWVDSIADNGRIVTKGGASGQRGWSLNVEGTEVWAFQIAVNSTTSLSLNVAGIPRNEWIHVAGVYDPSVPILRFYTNGILGGERTDSVPTTQFDSPLNVSIGARPNNQTWFDGRIDEVRIYTRALTDVEIAVLAQPPVVQPQFLPPTVSDGQIHLNWTGTGQLEWAPTVNGPWTAVTPPPSSSYSEAIVIGTNRFYRINAGP